MEPAKLKVNTRPEAKIQDRLIKRLLMEGWYAKSTHGNAYQSGFPDVFAAHVSYGSRWIEVKLPKGSKLEASQRETFHEFAKQNVGVWILTDHGDWEYNKLFKPANWYTFLEVMKLHNRASKIEIAKPVRAQADGPERRIQEAIKAKLRKEGWYCKDTYGGIYQSGFPDLYACHRSYGGRWIEVKNPKGYKFTPAQLRNFPLMTAHQVGIWIVTSPDEVPGTLFKPANWWQYLEIFRS